MPKNRRQKKIAYDSNYTGIPLDFYDRLLYMTDTYNLSENKMNEIIDKKMNMENNLLYYDLNIVLYEEPEGTPRPRFRIVNRKNFINEAITNSNFVHVYSINAKDDFLYMRRLVESELLSLEQLINTPCNIEFNAYFKTPSGFSITDKFMAELGLIDPTTKPDWDNIGKKYSDMYNHNVWIDDCLVKKGTVEKFYSILPRVEINLKYLNCVPNKYQYNMITNRKDFSENSKLAYLNNKGELVYE